MEKEDLFKKEIKEAGAELDWINYNHAQKVWRNPDNNKKPLVLYVELNYDFPNNYERHTFDKSWNEICRDPHTPDFIADCFRDGCADDVTFVYGWASKGQNPETAPFGIGELYLSDYPREVHVY